MQACLTSQALHGNSGSYHEVGADVRCVVRDFLDFLAGVILDAGAV